MFQPSFLPGFNLTVDYFNIEVEGLVSIVGAASTVNDCYTTANPVSCSKIPALPGTGQLWLGTSQVLDLNTNIGGLTAVGYDIANYQLEIGDMGSLAFQLIGTYMSEAETDPAPPRAKPPTIASESMARAAECLRRNGGTASGCLGIRRGI